MTIKRLQKMMVEGQMSLHKTVGILADINDGLNSLVDQKKEVDCEQWNEKIRDVVKKASDRIKERIASRGEFPSGGYVPPPKEDDDYSITDPNIKKRYRIVDRVNLEHSLDDGHTWIPCTEEETEDFKRGSSKRPVMQARKDMYAGEARYVEVLSELASSSPYSMGEIKTAADLLIAKDMLTEDMLDAMKNIIDLSIRSDTRLCENAKQYCSTMEAQKEMEERNDEKFADTQESLAQEVEDFQERSGKRYIIPSTTEGRKICVDMPDDGGEATYSVRYDDKFSEAANVIHTLQRRCKCDCDED